MINEFIGVVMDRLFEISSYASFIVYHIEAMDKIKFRR